MHALENQYLNDHTNTLSEMTLKDAATINQTLGTLPGKPALSMEVYDRIPNGQDIDKFKVKRFEQLGIGQKGWDNGLYFVLALKDKKICVRSRLWFRSGLTRWGNGPDHHGFGEDLFARPTL
ncbi:TPM domain-containing protein [Lacticaseibacillus manihotivorans]|uniref:TPM domain-containing protein n=1 Tax=Lacticaseibacillus manihotivorans TaxID=88233 RepID=UPI0006CFDAD5|nr:TPM domain-containing protein [Lacticaseibacillus manihotivorans]